MVKTKESATLTGPARRLDIEHWGLVPYAEAFRRQLALVKEVAEERRPDTIVVTEHPATITLGRHAQIKDITADQAALSQAGVEVVRTDRGGQATFHGPGQLVVYPIVDVTRAGLGVKQWSDLLLNCIQSALAELGVDTTVDPENPGVYTRRGKIASIGLRVKSGVSYHGVSVNTGLDVSGFGYIVACGKPDQPITSIERELKAPFNIDASVEALAECLPDRIAEALSTIRKNRVCRS